MKTHVNLRIVKYQITEEIQQATTDIDPWKTHKADNTVSELYIINSNIFKKAEEEQTRST